MTTISSVIFDLGNVIIDLDPDSSDAAFRRLGAQKPFSTVFQIGSQLPAYTHYEIGQINDAEFRLSLKDALQFDASDSDIDAAYTAMLKDIDVSRLELLQQLRQHCQVFLFSNTNAIHMRTYAARMAQQHGITGLQNYFDKIYFSYEMKTRKPLPEGFLHIINERKLEAPRTLFVDDVLENVQGAESVGLRGFHYAPGTTLQQVIDYIQRV